MAGESAKSVPVPWRAVLRDPVHWLPFGFGVGLLPKAPGTWGSLLAVFVAWWLPRTSWQVDLVVLSALFVTGVVVCGHSARRLGVHDHGSIVWDEIVAMLGVLAFTPHDVFWYGTAFLLFRFFDIFKPWPIREIDHRLAGGLGIMLDDGLAAVYAVLTVKGIQLLPLAG